MKSTHDRRARQDQGHTMPPSFSHHSKMLTARGTRGELLHNRCYPIVITPWSVARSRGRRGSSRFHSAESGNR